MKGTQKHETCLKDFIFILKQRKHNTTTYALYNMYSKEPNNVLPLAPSSKT